MSSRSHLLRTMGRCHHVRCAGVHTGTGNASYATCVHAQFAKSEAGFLILAFGQGHRLQGTATPDLKAENFMLTEDGKPLPVKSVQVNDAPACIGLMLDRSGSMRSKNSAAINALMSFVRAVIQPTNSLP